MAISARLKRQLPSTAPAARFGSFNHATAETPAASSGKEVTPAIRIAPIHARPKPVFSAITSPYFESREPAQKINTAQRRSSIQSMLFVYLGKQPANRPETLLGFFVIGFFIR